MTPKTSLWLALALGITLGGMNTVHAATTDQPAASDDPYLWLEATHDARAMDWVKRQNAITEKAFASSAEFERTRGQILEVLDSDARIPYVSRMGGYLYNFWQDKAQLARIAANSLFIWFLHLVQIWMFTIALNQHVPFLANLPLSPLAILAGLLPLTFAGVGTRDAALVFFYAPYMSAAAGAALGVLCTLRYVLPALLGLPFLGPAVAEMGGLKKLMARRADS